jgi:hypothetical protein
LFTTRNFLKIKQEAQILGLLFYDIKSMYQFWPNMGWATSWATFHQLIWSRCV